MTKVITGCLVAGGILAATPATDAATILTANLTHSQETTQGTFVTSGGSPRPESYGSAVFTLNDAMTELSMSVLIYNIDVTGTQTADVNDNLAAAHIHAPAPPGLNAGVVWGFFGTPDNDNNPDNLVVTPFAEGVGGQFTSIWNVPEGQNTTLTAQLPNILAGESYINFHTVQFGGGEIRGQITQVPEATSTALLLGSALTGIAILRRRFAREGAAA